MRQKLRKFFTSTLCEHKENVRICCKRIIYVVRLEFLLIVKKLLLLFVTSPRFFVNCMQYTKFNFLEIRNLGFNIYFIIDVFIYSSEIILYLYLFASKQNICAISTVKL